MLDLYDDRSSPWTSTAIRLPHRHGHRPRQQTLNAKEAEEGQATRAGRAAITIACHQATQGAVDGGRKAMEQCLSRDPDINVVYTINEPAGEVRRRPEGRRPPGQGVHRLHRRQLSGHRRRAERDLRRDATQYPGKMAQLGVNAIAKIAKGQQAPSLPRGKAYLDTGTKLVTAKPLPGIDSQTPDQGKKTCWGTAG